MRTRSQSASELNPSSTESKSHTFVGSGFFLVSICHVAEIRVVITGAIQVGFIYELLPCGIVLD